MTPKNGRVAFIPPVLFCIDFGESSPERAPKLGEDLIFNAPMFVVCARQVENCAESVWSFTPPVDDATDSICPSGYVVVARRDRSKYGGGVLILLQEHILFKEINTTMISVTGKAELVAVRVHCFLIACSYRQPSSTDVTLLINLDRLLDKYPLLSPVINVHESTWLYSSHTSSSGMATLDFCESRGLHQLVTFPTCLNAILDLIMTEYPSSTRALPNLNTSDHVAVLLTLSSFTHVIILADHRVYRWSRTPWGRLHHYFHSLLGYSKISGHSSLFCF